MSILYELHIYDAVCIVGSYIISDQASSERGKADYERAWEGVDAVRTAFESDAVGLEGALIQADKVEHVAGVP